MVRPLFKTRSTEPDTVWIVRISDKKHSSRWLLYNETHVMRGNSQETKDRIIRRWTVYMGPIQKLVRYAGVCTPFEASQRMETDMIKSRY